MDGYILILSKKHYNNMSELNNDEKLEYLNLINKYRDKFKKIYNKYPILFEHGDTFDNLKTTSISHAHTHVVNCKFKNEEDIINKLNFSSINNINEIDNNKNYIMYINNYNKLYITYNYNSISQLMRILIAKDLGIEDKYNWKKYNFDNNILNTINKNI